MDFGSSSSPFPDFFGLTVLPTQTIMTMMKHDGRADPMHRPCQLTLAVMLASGLLASSAIAQDGAPKRGSTATTAAGSRDGTKAAARHLPDSLRFANGLLRQRKFELAAAEFERFLKSEAAGIDAADARFGLANARLNLGQYPAALAAFEQFLTTAPDDVRAGTARYRIGELSYLVGDLAAARRSLEMFTAAKHGHAAQEMAWTYLGDACFGLTDLPAARRAYERSLELYPRGRMASRAKYGLARALADQGERGQAIEKLQELADAKEPEWLDRAWLQIGLIRYAAGQFDAAIEAFDTLEHAAPKSVLVPQARLQRAQAQARLGHAEDAQQILRLLAADAASPVGAQAALELATTQLENEHAPEALDTLDQALKRFPKSPVVPAFHFRSAEALRQQNRLADARARFLRVVELNPGDPWADDALQRAAQLSVELGEPAQARRWAAQLVAKFPNSPLCGEARLIEARSAMLDAKPENAIAILEPLLGLKAANPDAPKTTLPAATVPVAQYELALAYRAVGKSALADSLLASLARGPKNPVAADAQFLVGQASLEAGRFADAIPALVAYLAENPKGDVVDFAMAHLASARIGLGQLDEARKLLDMLAERFPRSRAPGPARLRLGEAELAAHHAERAAEQFRLAASTEPALKEPTRSRAARPVEMADKTLRIRALAGLGGALLELGKPADAASAFQSARELAGHEPIAAQIVLAQAQALEANRQIDPALDAYAATARDFPQSDQAPQALLASARLLAKSGRHQEAVPAFERLNRDDAACQRLGSAGVGRDTLLVEWAYALVDAAKPAEADHIFDQVLREFPDSRMTDDARFNLAESANQKREFAEVVRLLSPVAARKPADQGNPRLLPAMLYRLGRTQIELKDWAAAQKTFAGLIAVYPDNPYCRESEYLGAEAALREGDAGSALAGFTKLVATPPSPNDPPGMAESLGLKRIQCWVALKRWKEALDSATKLENERKPGDPAIAELVYARGQALLGMGRMADARAAFQKVLDTRPGAELGAQAQLMRGETYFHEEQFHEALREFLKVDILYKAPHWQATALLEAGKVYERLDQWADAAETYERLLKKFPSDPLASEARDRRIATGRRATSNTSSKKS
jgi:cellulose synthase operon protein C